jgi:hypothetical protein
MMLFADEVPPGMSDSGENKKNSGNRRHIKNLFFIGGLFLLGQPYSAPDNMGSKIAIWLYSFSI